MKGLSREVLHGRGRNFAGTLRLQKGGELLVTVPYMWAYTHSALIIQWGGHEGAIGLQSFAWQSFVCSLEVQTIED